MRPEEIVIIAILAWIIILILLRFTSIKEGIVQKRYMVGKAMTIGTRQIQEDNLGVCCTGHGFLGVLADGMGKEYGGKIAGRIAVDTFKSLFSTYNSFDHPIYFFNRAFRSANREILNQLDEGRGGASLGVVVLSKHKMFYAVVGNVKIAVYREGNLVPISSGHTIDILADESYRRGKLTRQDAISLLENHRLYNYLGQDDFKEIEIFDTPILLYEKDIVVLMSDGVYESIDWREIEEVLSQKKSCQDKAFEIIEMINMGIAGHGDNASILLMEHV